jgi:hypothetical protein
MVNSKVSRQWFCERYAVKALRVHGGGAVLSRTSCRVGRRGQYGPEMERLSGLDGTCSPEDMKPSSSASQSDNAEEQLGDASLDWYIWGSCAGGSLSFDLLIAIRRGYPINPGPSPFVKSSHNGCSVSVDY